jgi:hypothetical protein
LFGAVVVHSQQFGAAAAWNHPGGMVVQLG